MSRTAAWPAGLLGALALVWGVERFVSRHEPRFTTTQVSAWSMSGRRVGRAARCPVVAVGDSVVKYGVVPAVLADRLGRSAYNLAVPKGNPVASELLLRRVLRAGGRPSMVLLDGELLPDDPRGAARAWAELAGPADTAALAWAARDPRFLARALLDQLLPSFRARAEVRADVAAALAGTTPEECQALGVLWRNWNTNRGAQLLPPRGPGVADDRAEEIARSDYRPSDWSCHPLNAEYLERLLALAGSRGVPVVWLLPPYHPEVQARRERYGWDGKFEAFVRGLCRRHPGLWVVDARHAGYPPEALADMTHLNRPGALAYSDALGGLLAGLPLDGGRGGWVALPGYRPGAGSIAAESAGSEDVLQSSAALKRLAAGGPARVRR